MTLSARGRFAAVLFAGISLTLAGLAAVPAGASAAGSTGHKRSSSARRGRPARRHRPAVLGFAMVSAPVAQPVPRPAAPTGVPARAGSGGCGNVRLMPSASNLGAVGAATLCLINNARQAAGLVPLVANAALGRAATTHSIDMVAHDYFDHVGPDGLSIRQRARATGFAAYDSAGETAEIIAAAIGAGATPAATVLSWMSSSDHRANILNPDFRAVGVGVTNAAPLLVGRQSGATYTMDFA